MHSLYGYFFLVCFVIFFDKFLKLFKSVLFLLSFLVVYIHCNEHFLKQFFLLSCCIVDFFLKFHHSNKEHTADVTGQQRMSPDPTSEVSSTN